MPFKDWVPAGRHKARASQARHIREKSDAGLPVVATAPDGAHAKIYRNMAAKVRDQLSGSTAGLSAPKIVLEA